MPIVGLGATFDRSRSSADQTLRNPIIGLDIVTGRARTVGSQLRRPQLVTQASVVTPGRELHFHQAPAGRGVALRKERWRAPAPRLPDRIRYDAQFGAQRKDKTTDPSHCRANVPSFEPVRIWPGRDRQADQSLPILRSRSGNARTGQSLPNGTAAACARNRPATPAVPRRLARPLKDSFSFRLPIPAVKLACFAKSFKFFRGRDADHSAASAKTLGRGLIMATKRFGALH